MDIDTMREFFMWCTVINGAVLILSALVLATAADWIYRLRSKWFPITREAFNHANYFFLGLFKIVVIATNLVPFIALSIIR
jgi:hypothetical protein